MMDKETITMTRDELEDLNAEVTKNVLSRLGFDVDNPKEVRADLEHLRRWRVSVNKVSTIGMGAAITTIVSGLLAAVWIGVSHLIGQR